MKFKMPKNMAAAVAAATFATLAALPQARGELVYEDSNAAANTPTARSDEREQLRQVLNSSEKAQNTVQAQPVQQVVVAPPAPQQVYQQPTYAQPVYQTRQVVAVAPATAPVAAPIYIAQPMNVQPAIVQAQPAPVLSQTISSQPAQSMSTASDTSTGAPAASGDLQNLSKTEMMRRERVREELKNEDTLEERLEALRLRDEQRRTNQILGGPVDPTAPVPALAAPGVVGMQNEAVVAPVTDHPGEVMQAPALPMQAAPVQAAAPALTPVPGQPGYYYQTVAQPAPRADQLTTSSAMAVSQTTAPSDVGASSADKTPVSVSGRVGLANMSSVNGFDIHPSASFGVEAGVGITDNVSLTGGYQYSSFGVSLDESVYGINSSATPITNNMNQNLFEGGVKISLLGPDSRIRPFIAGGGGYAHSYINYASTLQGMVGNSPDYTLDQWVGYVGGGLDFKLGKNVSLGADFRYYDILTSSQNGNLNPNGFIGSGSAPINQAIGASLASQGYYTAGAALTFTF